MSHYPPPDIDYAVRQVLYKRFIPRPGFDRVGRGFDPKDMPDDEGRSSPAARFASSLSVERVLKTYGNPCDDVYEVKDERGRHHRVRWQWLRLYFEEARGQKAIEANA